MQSAQSIAGRLRWSNDRVKSLFPLTRSQILALSDEQTESIDALLFRYGSLVSQIQDHIFRYALELEQEDVQSMSNRDKTLAMEQFGAIDSARAFANVAEIRNKLMHDYPDDLAKQVDRINFAYSKVELLLQCVEKLDEHVKLRVQECGE